MKVLTVIIFLRFCVVRPSRHELRIGGLFEENGDDDRLAFQLAIEMVNEGSYNKIASSWAYVSHFNTLLASHTLCSMIEDGLVGIIGPTSPHIYPYVKGVCDVKDIPLIEVHWENKQKQNDRSVNLYPCPSELAKSFVDLIKAWEWQSFTILYEDNDGLLRMRELLQMYNYSEHTISLRQLNVNGDYRKTLMEIKRSGETHYIVDCPIDILEDVLLQAQQVGIMTDQQHYIILNLDMTSLDLSPFQYGGSNITGVSLVDPEDPHVVDVAQNLQQLRMKHGLNYEPFSQIAAWKLTTQTALIIDAVKLLRETLKELRVSAKLDVKPLYCNSSDIWEKGSSIVNYLKTQRLKGVSGLVTFDRETGARKEFTLQLIQLAHGGFTKVGTWNLTNGITVTRKYVKDTFGFVDENPMKNKMFKVITALTEPYGMLKNVSTTLAGNDRFEGYGIDLIDELSKKLHFRYTFLIQEDGLYGSYNPRTKRWDGMLGEVVYGRADFAIIDLTITSEREKAVDFTMPFMNLGISILYKKPEPEPPSLFTFAFPFSTGVWILMAVSYVLVSLSFFIMGRLCPSEWINPFPCVEEPEYLVNQFSFRNSLWFTFGSLMQKGSEVAPIGISTRMASGVWYFFILIMVSSYTANLAAFLTVEELVTPFDDVEDLALQDEVKYGAKKIGATRNFFKDSNYSVYPKIRKYMDENPDNMMETNDEGIEKVEQESYAFFMESTSIEYTIERHCNLTQIGGALDEKGYGIAMKKDSEYRHILSGAILELQESGKLAELKTKWWKEKRGGGKCEKRQPVATPLDLKNLGGVFFVLGIGTVYGVISTFVELAMYTKNVSKKRNEPFMEQIRREFRFFYSFRQQVKRSPKFDCDSIIEKTNNGIK